MNNLLLIIIILINVILVAMLLAQNLKLIKKLKINTEKFTHTIANLKVSEQNIKNLLLNLHVGIAVFSSKGELLLCNRKFFELVNFNRLQNKGKYLVEEALIKQHFIEHPPQLTEQEITENYINEDGRKLTIQEFPVSIVISSGKPLLKHITGIKDSINDKVRWVLGDHEPEFDTSGELSRIIVTLVDITDRKNSEEALRESENRLSAFLKVIPDMFFLFDRSGNLIDNYLENTAFPDSMRTDFIGKNIRNIKFIEKHVIESIFTNVENLFKMGEIQTFEFSFPKSDKDAFFEARFVLCGDDKVLAVVRDISKRKKAELELYSMSTQDVLTGLYNRNYFEHKLDKYHNKDITGVGIVICDIDGLKLVNDTLGHNMGDEYIKTVVNILCKCFDKNDIIARIGGDEFAVIIEYTTTKELHAIAIKIDESVNIINLGKCTIPVSMSLGYIAGNGLQKDIREVLKIADNLMYNEKFHHRQSKKSTNIDVLTKMLEVRDFITEGHGDRMQELCGKMAEAVGMSKNEIEDMRLFAKLHDIGKVGITDRILFKTGSLTKEEMDEMKLHTKIGFRIANSSMDLIHISDWILKHHEWWDGNGYPLKLRGEEIPLQSRILSIVDAFDAMTNNRPYRKALSKEEALIEIMKFTGTQFDPALVDEFIQLI